MPVPLPIIVLIFLTMNAINTGFAAGGIQIGRTRVIYDASKKEVALPVINKENELPWLVQSWVDTGDGKTRGPFIVTPPLFRLNAQREQSLRIIWSGAVMQEDRESLYYINVRTIPGSDTKDENKNVLRLIYKTRLKLFFRPKDLEGEPGEACAQLQFTLNGDDLQVKNPSRYYIVFDSLYFGNKQIRHADMIAPLAGTSFPLPVKTEGHNITWRCITDYGNASDKYSDPLPKG
ncbi:molecular chaperone [Scandinavium sp. H11S7]|uniref:fimbrial biogenesis chaperone n=1 Tax=Scandinavium TaxID=2726810 RepID=UPI00135B138F|nr:MULTISPECIES: molecular chaperone [Scandinavium]MCS2159532.1 molecular chaperone [Scandinavium hiltneri]MCS2171605.1 molecular chaperone [Scandinavium tedordense]